MDGDNCNMHFVLIHKCLFHFYAPICISNLSFPYNFSLHLLSGQQVPGAVAAALPQQQGLGGPDPTTITATSSAPSLLPLQPPPTQTSLPPQPPPTHHPPVTTSGGEGEQPSRSSKSSFDRIVEKLVPYYPNYSRYCTLQLPCNALMCTYDLVVKLVREPTSYTYCTIENVCASPPHVMYHNVWHTHYKKPLPFHTLCLSCDYSWTLTSSFHSSPPLPLSLHLSLSCQQRGFQADPERSSSQQQQHSLRSLSGLHC